MIIAGEARQERVSSMWSLKSRKHDKFILNLLISRSAQGRDHEEVEIVVNEVSTVDILAV